MELLEALKIVGAYIDDVDEDVQQAFETIVETLRAQHKVILKLQNPDVYVYRTEGDDMEKAFELTHAELARENNSLVEELARKDAALSKIAGALWHESMVFDMATELQMLARQALIDEEE